MSYSVFLLLFLLQDSLALSNSPTDDDSTPVSSKRVLELKDDVSDQSSATKKLCLDSVDLDGLPKEQGSQIYLENEEPKTGDAEHQNGGNKIKAVRVKIEKPPT